MKKLIIPIAGAAIAVGALSSTLMFTANPARSAPLSARALAAAGTTLFSSRPDYFTTGSLTCKQETPVSYYCYTSGGATHFFVSVANGMATGLGGSGRPGTAPPTTSPKTRQAQWRSAP
jgi:hypothetical protein